MTRVFSVIWALVCIACGPMGIFLFFHFARQGDPSRGVFDLLFGLVVCAIGVGNLREARS